MNHAVTLLRQAWETGGIPVVAGKYLNSFLALHLLWFDRESEEKSGKRFHLLCMEKNERLHVTCGF